MKKIINLLTIACVIACTAMAINAQTNPEPNPGLGWVFPDKAKNQTFFQVQERGISNPGPKIILNASQTVPETGIAATPEDIMFTIQIASPDRYKYPDSIAMKVKIDGKAIPDIKISPLDKRIEGKNYLETLGTRMNYDVFRAIANAKSVEFKVDGMVITVGADKLAKFADLVKTIG